MKIHCLYDKLVPTSEIKFHPLNPNKHTDNQVKRLGQILGYQGWRSPIKVSKRSGYVTSGHGRMLAAIENKWLEVPVNFQDYENEDQEMADLVSDNSIASWSELDLAMINSEFIPSFDPSFDIDLLGLKDFCLDPSEKGQCDEDEVPEKVEPRTKLGDLYQLGDHRLLCGDSTDILQVEKLMNGERADMVYTDPPYGISIDTHYKNVYGHNEYRDTKNYKKIAGDDEAFDPSFIFSSFLDTPIFIWGANNFIKKLPENGAWNIWEKKTTDNLKKLTGWDFEMLWTNQKGGRLYEVTWAGCYGHNKKDDGDKKVHPTMKPIKLHEKFFQEHDGHNVVDLFGGSGSTLIACEKTNRKCFMLELEPHYCDVIVARFEKYSNKKAELIKD